MLSVGRISSGKFNSSPAAFVFQDVWKRNFEAQPKAVVLMATTPAWICQKVPKSLPFQDLEGVGSFQLQSASTPRPKPTDSNYLEIGKSSFKPLDWRGLIVSSQEVLLLTFDIPLPSPRSLMTWRQRVLFVGQPEFGCHSMPCKPWPNAAKWLGNSLGVFRFSWRHHVKSLWMSHRKENLEIPKLSSRVPYAFASTKFRDDVND